MTTNMGRSKESTFAELMLVVSNWYDERIPISMLKVLFRDHIDDTFALYISSKTIDLMNMLITFGSLSPTDLTLLYDTIMATKQFGLGHEIQNRMPSFQIAKNIRKKVITTFTLHRQRLVKLGMALTPSDVQKLCHLYKVKHTDRWSLIMDLEHNMVICEENMDTFIDKLKTHNLHQAVKSLTEDIPNPSSNPGEASGVWKAGCLLLVTLTISLLMYAYQESLTLEFIIITTAVLFQLRGQKIETNSKAVCVLELMFLHSVYYNELVFDVDFPYLHYDHSNHQEFVLSSTLVIGIMVICRIDLSGVTTTKVEGYICNFIIAYISLFMMHHFKFLKKIPIFLLYFYYTGLVLKGLFSVKFRKR